MKIYVGNLAFNTTEELLRQAFEAYGKVESAEIIVDRATNQSRGFGFVEMEDPAEAEKAIEAMNGGSLDGRTLRVNEARPRADRERREPRHGGRS
ncbi:MAG: RNA-binding protein [Candidatus Sumerlaeota bacterium]|nr:RNA-binding protein [Candidatus Sumerlaeota bacterium]